jgi:hypothetical protein
MSVYGYKGILFYLYQELCREFDSIQLVQCQDCDRWGHSVCFGYEKFQNGDYHSCFDCSPLQNTADTATINEVALLRLGIALVFEKGIQSRNWFSTLLGIKLINLTLGLSLVVTNQLIAQLRREGFIIQKKAVDRRTKVSFDPVVNPSTISKKRDIFHNNYFDEIFLRTNHVSRKAEHKRKTELAVDTVRDDIDPFPGVCDMDTIIIPSKKRKVSVSRKTLVVL